MAIDRTHGRRSQAHRPRAEGPDPRLHRETGTYGRETGADDPPPAPTPRLPRETRPYAIKATEAPAEAHTSGAGGRGPGAGGRGPGAGGRGPGAGKSLARPVEMAAIAECGHPSGAVLPARSRAAAARALFARAIVPTAPEPTTPIAGRHIEGLSTTADSPTGSDGEVSRHLPRNDQAAASRRIQQRHESPAFVR
jgi:hypothetical protein